MNGKNLPINSGHQTIEKVFRQIIGFPLLISPSICVKRYWNGGEQILKTNNVRKGFGGLAFITLVMLLVVAGQPSFLSNNVLLDTLDTINTVDATNLTINADADAHSNIIQLDLTITVSQNYTILLHNIYLNHTQYTWFFRAASKNLEGTQYWSSTSNLFSDLPQQSRIVNSTRTFYALDFAYSGNSPDNSFAHSSLNLGGPTSYTWELFLEWSLTNDTQNHRNSFLYITTPNGNITSITRTMTSNSSSEAVTTITISNYSTSSHSHSNSNTSSTHEEEKSSSTSTSTNTQPDEDSSTTIATLGSNIPQLRGFTFMTNVLGLSAFIFILSLRGKKKGPKDLTL